MLSVTGITSIISAWPVNHEDLPPSVRATCNAWNELTVAELTALIRELHSDHGVEFTTTSSKGLHKRTKCLALTVHSKVPPGETSPLPDEPRSMISASTASTLEQRLKAMENQLNEARSTIASLTRQ